MLIVNDPLNVRIVGGTSALRTTSVDVEVLDIAPGNFGGTSPNGVFLCNYCPQINMTAGFSFAPANGFVEVKRVMLTFTYLTYTQTTPREFSIRLNDSAATIVSMHYASTTTSVVPLSPQNPKVGANIIDIGVSGNQVQAYVFQVRLTVEYTLMA